MINIETHKNSAIVHAKVVGKIETGDWTEVATLIDPIIVEHMSVSLLLDATDFEGWDDMYALRNHFKFVKLRHDNVDRIALVTSKNWQIWVAGMAKIFVGTDIRTFDKDEMKDALDWLNSDILPAFTILATGQPNIFGMSINGKLKGSDYEKTLTPLMEEMLRSHDKISCYVDMSGFKGFDASAFWQDFSFGMRHWNNFERIAMVGASGWMENMTKMFDKITPNMELKCFDKNERDEAWKWLKKA